ncbi:DUF5683 domain-containing protein [Mucilaginibacter sp.]|jgi:hypothetical protein|uniref:DUF5683 domain-containing protein n=1 Tax=Mucilaginibacter sp. TaxID=1882438 RepID=UPI0035615867
MFKYFLGAVFFMLTGFCAITQAQDTVVRKKADTTVVAPPKKVDDAGQRFVPKLKKEKVYHPDSTHIPSLAVKRSLIIPGWGQWYNRRGAWWKIPAIYAGLGALGYSIVESQKNYKMFLALYRIRNTGVVPTLPGQPYYAEYKKYEAEYNLYSRSPISSLQEAASNYQRNFQISILSVVAVWGVQAVEAYIEAKFINSFTVDNDLSMKVTPGFINQSTYAMANVSNAYIPGIKITFTLK